MATFSQNSLSKLSTCHILLQELFSEVIKYVDCKVEFGHRNREDQEACFLKGTSRAHYGQSKHNYSPSLAIDVIPYPVEWPDPQQMSKDEYARSLGRFYMFVGYVRCLAQQKGINIMCGADWDGDFNIKDQNFHDLPHFELVGTYDSRIPE